MSVHVCIHRAMCNTVTAWKHTVTQIMSIAVCPSGAVSEILIFFQEFQIYKPFSNSDSDKGLSDSDSDTLGLSDSDSDT